MTTRAELGAPCAMCELDHCPGWSCELLEKKDYPVPSIDTPNILYAGETNLSFRRVYGAPCMTCTDEDCPGWVCEALEVELPEDLLEIPEDPDERQKMEVAASLYRMLWQVHYFISSEKPDDSGRLAEWIMKRRSTVEAYAITAVRFYGLWRVYGWLYVKDKMLVSYSGAAKDQLRNLAAKAVKDISEG